MTLRVRLRFSKSLLRRGERVSFTLGVGSLGFCAVVLGQAWFLQTYENWAFEQEQRGSPVSYAGFLADAVSMPVPAPPEAASPFAARGPAGRAMGFEPPVDRSIVGRIEIPGIDLKAMIHEGVAQRTLALAVGHIPGTALPGKTGNVGIAGHRDTFFRGLQRVHRGDAIILTTLDGSYEYRVESAEVVAPGDTRVLADSSQPELTLVTCYPFYYVGPAPERFIVHAKRVKL